MATEEDLEYLWRPKRTLRDWGETNYNIVRNWTPHNKKLASLSNSSNKSKTSVTKLSPAKKLPSASSTKARSAPTSFQGEASTSYRLRRSSRKQQQSVASSESSWYVPDDPTVGRGSISFRLFKRNNRDRNGLLSDEIDKNEQIHSAAYLSRSSISSSTESPNGAHLSLTDTSDRQLLSPNSKAQAASLEDGNYYAHNGDDTYMYMYEGEEKGAPVQRPGNEDSIDGGEDDDGHVANGEGMDDAEPMDDMDTDVLLPPSSRQSADLSTQSVSSKPRKRKSVTGRGKRPSSKPKRSARKVKDETSVDDNECVLKVKLWHPEGGEGRMIDSVNEPAHCPTLYDHIIKEALSAPNSGVMQNVMDSHHHHWEETQKQNLSTNEDLSSVAALEERLREEKRKHNQLQKEMLISLNRSNGEYCEAVVRVKRDKQRREKKAKHTHLQNEMHAVLKSLRRSNGEYREALAKAEKDQHRHEALDVERQIAEVGMLLHSSSPS